MTERRRWVNGDQNNQIVVKSDLPSDLVILTTEARFKSYSTVSKRHILAMTIQEAEWLKWALGQVLEP